jgi:hypothetical protein
MSPGSEFVCLTGNRRSLVDRWNDAYDQGGSRPLDSSSRDRVLEDYSPAPAHPIDLVTDKLRPCSPAFDALWQSEPPSKEDDADNERLPTDLKLARPLIGPLLQAQPEPTFLDLSFGDVLHLTPLADAVRS